MKPSRDKPLRPWMIGLGASSLVFLLVGWGIGEDTSHRELAFQDFAAQESNPTTAGRGLSDFVALAKRLKPGVVNISTTQINKRESTRPTSLNKTIGLALLRLESNSGNEV